MKNKRIKTLWEKTFEFDNGNRLSVTNKGFTLWDDSARVWVLDASTLAEDNSFVACDGLIHKKEQRLYPWYKFNCHHQTATRTKYKTKKRKRVKP